MLAEDQLDLYRTGPGTLAGRYWRMFWPPVYGVDDLRVGRAAPHYSPGASLPALQSKRPEPVIPCVLSKPGGSRRW
jgi:hypothetical protein